MEERSERKAMRRYTQTNKPNFNLKIRWAKDEHMGVYVCEYNFNFTIFSLSWIYLYYGSK